MSKTEMQELLHPKTGNLPPVESQGTTQNCCENYSANQKKADSWGELMAYDGKVLARVREIIAERKRNNESEQGRRRDAVYARIPAIMDIEAEITKLMSGVVAEALKKGADAGAAVESAKERCDTLLKRRAELLISGGYPANYIDEIHDCPVCGDTGYVLGKPCSCLKALYQAETVGELSQMLNINGQCFETFDLNFYDSTPDYETGKSPSQTFVCQSLFPRRHRTWQNFPVRFNRKSRFRKRLFRGLRYSRFGYGSLRTSKV